MTHIKTKLILAGLALTLAVGYLAFAGIQGGWVYHLEVDDFLANAKYQDQRVRLCGRAADDGFTSAGAAGGAFRAAGQDATRGCRVSRRRARPSGLAAA